MKKASLFLAAVAIAFGTGAASAQPYDGPPNDGPPPQDNSGPPPGDYQGPSPGADPYGYYSQYDHTGYYDRDGHYRNFDNGPPPPPPTYYQQGRYENDCHRGNTAAGTLFGGLAGGLIGGAASHGNGGAVVGGVILGGLLGNAMSRDIGCEDQHVAFQVYAEGLDGPIGSRHEWHGDRSDDYGYFTPTREFTRGGFACREFETVTYHNGHESDHTGTACKTTDGHWHFD